MTGPTPCYRHPRKVWLAACPDCTAWHLATLRDRRDEVVPTASTATQSTTPSAALRLVA
jgi:hypothetical protein